MKKIKGKYSPWFLCVVQSLFCGPAFPEDMDIKKNPVTVPIGPFDFSPVFEMGETFNDNIFRITNAKSSFVTQINAGAQLALKQKLNRYGLTYALQSSQYHSSPQDDYVDQYVGVNSHNEFTSRNHLDLDMSYLNSHYMRSSFLDRDITNPALGLTEPDQYHSYNANARYRYGLPGAKANMELQMNFADYTFDNHPSRNAVQDRNSAGFQLGLFYQAFPNTKIIAQLESNWLIHKEASAAEFDSNKQRFLVGGTWLYSNQFELNAKAGYLNLSIDNPLPNVNEYDGVTWDATLAWSPLPYSRVSFNTNRNAVASINRANIRTSERYRINWTHDWSSRISTQLTTSYESANNLALHRKDDFVSFGLDLNYGVRRWLGFGINYTYRTLQSDLKTIDFDQNTILFFVTANPRISDEVKAPWANWY